MRLVRLVLMGVLVCLGTLAAGAGDRKDDDITVDITVHFNTAYRENTWVPVDVSVTNDAFDVSGWIDVRVFDTMGELRSPVYRVPAESPKGSRKRFRAYCLLGYASRIEAQLYHKGRPATLFPAYYQNPQPIDPNGILALILTEEPSDFGFLYRLGGSGDTERRVHRENLNNERLDALADYPQCYRPFNVVVMGEIDPSRIAMRHRDLIRTYVETGGTLVVCTGADANLYRGSWVEELMGVSVGATSTVKETDLVRAAFGYDDPQTTKEWRECVFAELIPQSAAIKTIGNERVLAAVNQLGNGRAAAIAVDASSKVLQDFPAYLEFWKGLLAESPPSERLNLTAAVQKCAQMLPAMAGLEIASRVSVMVYLCSYLLIGIVANWVVCSLLKRREAFWVLLILFSFGFTGYAMVFGTVGLFSKTELEQIDVVFVPRNSAIAEVYSVVGILPGRTSYFSMELGGEDVLIRDPYAVSDIRQGYRAHKPRPFHFVEDTPAQAANLRAGSGEMRFILAESMVRAPGAGIVGSLIHDNAGIHGELENNTGLDLDDPVLLIDGAPLPVTDSGRRIQVSFSQDKLNTLQPNQLYSLPAIFSQMAAFPAPQGFRGDSRFATFRMSFLVQLFTSRDNLNEIGAQTGPFFCAWTKTPIGAEPAVSKPAERHIRETLIIAEIEVEERFEPGKWFPLGVEPSTDEGGAQVPVSFERDGDEWIAVSAPPRLVNSGQGEILIEIDWYPKGGEELRLCLNQNGKNWFTKEPEESTVVDRGADKAVHLTYRITDITSVWDEGTRTVRGQLWSVEPGQPSPCEDTDSQNRIQQNRIQQNRLGVLRVSSQRTVDRSRVRGTPRPGFLLSARARIRDQ